MNQPTSASSFWRKCTTCKKPIGFGQVYWICSVSTCNRVRSDLVFCDLRCFDAHVPVMNHRDAGAFEKKAPLTAEPKEEKKVSPIQTKSQPQSQVQQRTPSYEKSHTQNKNEGGSQTEGEVNNDDILVVASKVKEYIRMKSGMNTSANVMEVLSKRVRRYSDQAIEKAKKEGRKTLLDRDL